MEGIIDTLVEKLIRRHPHVFADGDIEGVVLTEARSSVEGVKETWESIKQEERAARSQIGILADVPTALPALPRAQKLQKRAARVAFDWPDASAVLVKLEEELGELREAMAGRNTEQVEEELGDLLFTCVNLSRHLGLDAESSLRRASSKFEQRFQGMEELAKARGGSLAERSPQELDELWRAIKGDGNG
jgi:ATP diphosphatase